jgi:hypothetical protein
VRNPNRKEKINDTNAQLKRTPGASKQSNINANKNHVFFVGRLTIREPNARVLLLLLIAKNPVHLTTML